MLFDPRTAVTHYLSPVAVRIIELLMEEPAETDCLLDRLEDDLRVALGSEERERIEVAVKQVAALGLIERG